MNLFETQDRLNSLPPSPQTLQYLSAAAEGQNPNVPPWLALVRMTEIQKEMQSTQQMQQSPQGQPGQQGPGPTVKDQIKQASGIMTLQQQQQQAAMQKMAQQAAQPGGMPPQGAPAGIASVAPPQAFRMGGGIRGYAHGGGIRHFYEGGDVDALPSSNPGEMRYYQELMARRQKEEAEAEKRAREQFERMRQAAAIPTPVPEDYNKTATREGYERMGIADPRATYDASMQRAQALEARRAQEEATRAQEQQQMSKMGFFGSLLEGGEATRGARGSGLAALMGGYGRAQLGANAAQMQTRRESEADMMQKQAEIQALMNASDTGRAKAAETFGGRGVEYGRDVAGIKAGDMERKAKVEDLIGRYESQGAGEATKAASNIEGRMTSGMFNQKTALAQNFDTRVALAAKVVQESEGELKRYQTEIANIRAGKSAAKTTQEMQTALKAAEDGIAAATARRQRAQQMYEELLREAQSATRGTPGGGAAMTGGSPAQAQGGTMPPPRTAISDFRSRFPTSR